MHPQRQCYRLRLHLQPPPPPLPPSPPQQPPPALAHSAAAARACSCAAFASAISAASGSLRDACFSACASASFIDRAVLSLLHHTHTHTHHQYAGYVCCERKLEGAVCMSAHTSRHTLQSPPSPTAAPYSPHPACAAAAAPAQTLLVLLRAAAAASRFGRGVRLLRTARSLCGRQRCLHCILRRTADTSAS